MCIAILTPKNKVLSRETLNICWLNNFNGAGFTWNDDDNKMQVFKEMEDFDKFYNKYKKVRTKFPKTTMMVHFRISTHGIINKANCHPFKVNSELGFIHNGVINGVGEDDRYSDTNMFNRNVLKHIPNLNISMLRKKGLQTLLGDFIGYSKLVFMDSNGKYAIINEQKGHWAKGIWYSNDSYKKVKDIIDYGGVSRSRSSFGYGSYGTKQTDSLGTASTFNSHAGYKPKGFISNRNETPSTDVGKNSKSYKVSDGGDVCSCCGTFLWEGELISKYGECGECLSEEEMVNISCDAVRDGAILSDINIGGAVIAEFEDEEFEDENQTALFDNPVIECDFCNDSVKSSDTVHVEAFRSDVCNSCIDKLVDEGYMTHGDSGKLTITSASYNID